MKQTNTNTTKSDGSASATRVRHERNESATRAQRECNARREHDASTLRLLDAAPAGSGNSGNAATRVAATRVAATRVLRRRVAGRLCVRAARSRLVDHVLQLGRRQVVRLGGGDSMWLVALASWGR